MKRFILGFLTMALLAGCTTPGTVHDLDEEELEAKGKTLDGDVGINSKDQAIIRSKKSAADELRVQDMVNMHLRDALDVDLADLKDCRQQRADKRLGGDGRVARMPELDEMKAAYEVREQLGVDSEGNLSVLREQLFVERLKAERDYETTLRTMAKTVKNHLEECSFQLAEQRRGAGLPGQQTKAQGYFDAKGNWVENKRGAHTIDDEFEIQADRQKAEPDASDAAH